MSVDDLAERLWAKVDRSGGPRECWPWTGSVNATGHGRIGGGPGVGLLVVSRVAWEATFGPITDPRLRVLHSCDNPPCCNPGHLMLGMLQANSVDAGRKGRLGTGKNATHCKRGHPFDGNTRIHPGTGRRQCQACITLRSHARSAPVADRGGYVPGSVTVSIDGIPS